MSCMLCGEQGDCRLWLGMGTVSLSLISYDLEKISEDVLTWIINLAAGSIQPHAI